ncbi:hypothetical protein ACB092_08G078500 [Castanea dentata]
MALLGYEELNKFPMFNLLSIYIYVLADKVAAPPLCPGP